ncbi:transposase [Nonomuraea sp. NPDC026600]|uniref:transposase n=1 Tax=Nonomuraea sp. NPDC026600 TaxID=3155363 RepID=UPI0033EA1D27
MLERHGRHPVRGVVDRTQGRRQRGGLIGLRHQLHPYDDLHRQDRSVTLRGHACEPRHSQRPYGRPHPPRTRGLHTPVPAPTAHRPNPHAVRRNHAGCPHRLRERAGRFNGERDHVHLLVHHPPQVSLARLVGSFKSVSARRSRQQYPDHIRAYLRGAHVCHPRTSQPRAAAHRCPSSRNTSRIRNAQTEPLPESRRHRTAQPLTGLSHCRFLP